jgi:hypothetical protein
LTVVVALTLCTGAYFLWQFFKPATAGAPTPPAAVKTQGSPEKVQLAPPQGPSPIAPAFEDRFEIEPDPPRRGIPR